MRVIKVGKLPETIKHVAACTLCRTEVEFSVGEARIFTGQTACCINDSFLIVSCPICKHEIWKEV